jgi:hypothetical protein
VYVARDELAAFDVLSQPAKCRIILAKVRSLIVNDLEILRELRDVPCLYESGVRYRYQPAIDDWQDILRALQTGGASCNSLTAWRCAELQLCGEAAQPIIRSRSVRKPDGSLYDIFHVILLRPQPSPYDWEDPSVTLGMPPGSG